MKKYIVYCCVSLCLFACKKEQNAEKQQEDVKKYPVAFGVEDFKVSTGPFKKSALSAKGTLSSEPFENTKLMYAVYNEQGLLISRLEQYSKEPNKLYRINNNQRNIIGNNSYGSIVDSLPIGKYNLFVAMGDEKSSLHVPLVFNQQNNTYTDPFSIAVLSQAKFYVNWYGFPMDDGFVYKGELTVASVNAPKTITLNRIVGKINFVIEDAIPANAMIASFKINNNSRYYNITTGQAEGSTNTAMGISLYNSWGETNWTTDFLVLNTTTEVSMTAEFLDSQFKVIVSKTIPVKVLRNQQVTVTGKMSTTTNGLNVTVNPVWDATGTTVRF